MTAILFEPFESLKKKCVPYKKFAFTLRRFIQGSAIGTSALNEFREVTFQTLAHDRGEGFEDLCPERFLNFDALAGDCACQIRPSMLHVIVEHAKTNKERAIDAFNLAIIELKKMQTLAIQLHERLCSHDEHPKTIVEGAKNGLNLYEFAKITGISRWFEFLENPENNYRWTSPTEASRACLSQGNGASLDDFVDNFRLHQYSFVIKFIISSYFIGRYKMATTKGSVVHYRIDPYVRGVCLTTQEALSSYEEETLDKIVCKHRKGPTKCSWSSREETWRTIENDMVLSQRYVYKAY